MRATLISYGYKSGDGRANADEFIDARIIANPFSLPNLRPLNGLDERVQKYVAGDPNTRQVMALARLGLRDGVKIGIGCYGGKHRSVAVAELLAKELRAEGWEIEVEHRDLPVQELAHA